MTKRILNLKGRITNAGYREMTRGAADRAAAPVNPAPTLPCPACGKEASTYQTYCPECGAFLWEKRS